MLVEFTNNSDGRCGIRSNGRHTEARHVNWRLQVPCHVYGAALAAQLGHLCLLLRGASRAKQIDFVVCNICIWLVVAGRRKKGLRTALNSADHGWRLGFLLTSVSVNKIRVRDGRRLVLLRL